MNTKAMLLFCVLLAWALAGCSQAPVAPAPAADAEDAGELVRVVNLMVAGSFTGEESGIRAYLDGGAHGREVRELLVKDGLDPEAPQAKFFWLFPRLPKFGDTAYAQGDILLSRDICSWTSNLLAWLLQSRYTHCGVLDRDLFLASQGSADPRDIGCILSATLNEEVSGVTYETWRDWSTASTVTQLRVKAPYAGVIPALHLAEIQEVFNDVTTEYSFLYVDPATSALLPVPADPIPGPITSPDWPPLTHADKWGDFGPVAAVYNGDPVLWYCSKTTWWAFRQAGLDIENNRLIDLLGEARVRSSGFYQLYKLLYGEQLAFNFCYFAADMCVWPDEIRAAADTFGDKPAVLDRLATWGLRIE